MREGASLSGIHAVENAWHPQRVTVCPIHALRTAVDCIKAGKQVPEPAASVLVCGLERFLNGMRFEFALGLYGSTGKRTPVQEAALAWRDGKIKELAYHLPGEQCKAKAQAVMAKLHADSVPEPGPYVSQADLIAYELRTRAQYGLDLPTSLRQYQRVIGGR